MTFVPRKHLGEGRAGTAGSFPGKGLGEAATNACAAQNQHPAGRRAECLAVVGGLGFWLAHRQPHGHRSRVSAVDDARCGAGHGHSGKRRAKQGRATEVGPWR